MFQAKGVDVKEVYPRARVKRQGLAVDEFIEKLTKFKITFPHYKNFKAYGAVAGIEINEGIDRYAYKKGLFVIKPSGDTVEIINDEQFQPESW